MYETAKETLMYRAVLWTLWERERVGRFGRMAMKHVTNTFKFRANGAEGEWSQLGGRLRTSLRDQKALHPTASMSGS